MMKRCKYTFCALVILFSFMIAQTMPGISSVYADENIKPSIDVAQYRDANHNAYMEICYSLPESGIRYVPDSSGQFHCQIVMDVQVFFNEALWANKAWKIEKAVADTNQVSESSQIVDLIRYTVDKPGEYTIKMHVRDMNRPGSVDSSQTVFTAREFSEDEVDVSGVQFASTIRKAAPDMPSNFVKNNYEVVPVPAGIFGEGATNLYYYFEAYNLLDNIDADKYKSICTLKDPQGQVVEGTGKIQRTKTKMYDSSVEVGMINIAGLPSGKYSLNYGVADLSGSFLASAQKSFFVYNPSIPMAAAAPEEDLGALVNFEEKELDDEFKKLGYITTTQDREFYESLENEEAKRKFISSIWNRPREGFNVIGLQLRELYLARAHFAEENFKSVFDPGWRSDRGRVFILYGPPTHIERFPSVGQSIPYQIWTYDELQGQGGVQFVFGDRTNLGKYELLHSDLRGELQNRNWQRDVARGSNEFDVR